MGWANWLEGVRGWRAGPRRASLRRAPQGRGIEALEIRNLLSATGGTGTFANGINLPSASHVTLGDLDSDGDLDALTSPGSQWMEVLLNDGTAGFTPTGQNFATSEVQNAALGDVDGDGDLDAFVARGSTSGGPDSGRANEVWLNNGDGTFVNSEQQLGNSLSMAVGLIDLDSDGDLDAFVANAYEGHQIWLNDGTGQFSDTGQRLNNTMYTSDVELGDLDNDGDIDAVVGGARMSVWLNDGNASFTQSIQPMAVRNIPAIGVALGDVDGDGDLDAVVGVEALIGQRQVLPES